MANNKKTFNIAILGMGTVGSGTYNILKENSRDIEKRCGASIVVKKVLVRDKNKKRSAEVPDEAVTDNAEEIFNDKDINIIVELIGGVNPAFDYIIKAIENGKHIVTANKEVMAKRGHEILKKAEEFGVQVFFEASVAGGIPIIKAMKESLTANKIEQVMGIINGTTNYILTKMTDEGMEFDEVLKEAQAKGYAEANPASDVKGYDAAYKLSILSSIAFNSCVDIEKVYTEGIENITSDDIEYAKDMGYIVKLLAIGKEKDGKLELRVHPTLLPKSHPLSAVNDVFNAVFVKGNAVGELMFYGRGAGDLPTGSAVVSDIISVVNKQNGYTSLLCGDADNRGIHIQDSNSIICSCYDDKDIVPKEYFNTKYYIRLIVKERPGVLAKITGILGNNDVSISSVIQKERGENVPLVFITHEVLECNIMAALNEIEKLEEVKNVANVIRVEGN